MGFVGSQHVGSFRTRNQSGVFCIGRWILCQWTTREAWTPPLLPHLTLITFQRLHLQTPSHCWGEGFNTGISGWTQIFNLQHSINKQIIQVTSSFASRQQFIICVPQEFPHHPKAFFLGSVTLKPGRRASSGQKSWLSYWVKYIPLVVPQSSWIHKRWAGSFDVSF